MRICTPSWATVVSCVVAVFAAPCAEAACDSAPWLTLEVVAGELAGDGLAEFVEVDQSGCVLSQYADFDLRAGQYERRLSDRELASLADALTASALLGYDVAAHRADRAAAEQAVTNTGVGEVHYVADADWVRLQIRQPGGSTLIEWPSPELYAELDPTDTRLAKLADFVRRLRAEGADARRTRTTGGAP